MQKIRALAATGILGSGFKIESFEKGLSWKPDFIGCDAGTTDFGPYFLGSGESYFSNDAVKRDLRLILLGAQKNGIPAIIGSAGTSGADIQVEHTIRILQEIHDRIHSIYGEKIKEKYNLLFRVYGRNAVMAELEPIIDVGHEVGILIEILADTEVLARSIASAASHIALHYPVPEWSGLITGLALPHSPAEIFKGAI